MDANSNIMAEDYTNIFSFNVCALYKIVLTFICKDSSSEKYFQRYSVTL